MTFQKCGGWLPFLLLLLHVLAFPGRVGAQAVSLYRVNAGGPAFTDSSGQAWTSDEGFFNTGRAYSQNVSVSGTNDPSLYQTERYDLPSGAEMLYSFPVANGDYRVRLHFAEIYIGTSSLGKRVFDIEIEGQTVLSSFDIFGEAGFRTALVEEVQTQVSDGVLSLRFLHKVENPKISGIEIETISEPAPRLMATPESLDFGQVVLPGGVSVRTLDLKNDGTAPLILGALNWVGPQAGAFAVSPPSTSTLAPGESAVVSVTFSPSVEGFSETELEILSNDMQSPLRIPGSGTAMIPAPPEMTVSPSSLSFGNTQVGQTSAPKQVTLSNPGGQDLSVTLTGMNGPNPGDFATTASSSFTVPPGGSISLQVRFSPSAQGPRAAQWNLASNASSGAVAIPLSGIGTDAPPLMNEVLYRVNAGGVAYTDPAGNLWSTDSAYVNTGFSYSQNVAIMGTELDPLYQSERWDRNTLPEMMYSFPVAPGDYSVRLHFAEVWIGAAAEGKRVFDVRAEGSPVLEDYNIYMKAGFRTAAVEEFTIPVADGTLNLEFLHQVENPKVSAIEVAALTEGVPRLVASTASLDFGGIEVGGAATQTVTVSNTGSIPVEFITPNLTGAAAGSFTVVPAIGFTLLDPGASSDFQVAFSPQATGNLEALLSIFSNDPNAPLEISLAGQGLPHSPHAPVSASPPQLSFSDQPVGTQSPPQPVQISNPSSDSRQIDQIALAGPAASSFTVASLPFPIALPAQGLTTVEVRFLPQSAGIASATLRVWVSPDSQILEIPLEGTGSGEFVPLVASPSSVPFGSVMVGEPSSLVTVTLSNPTPAAHTIHQLELLGLDSTDFTVTGPTLPLTLEANQSTALSLRFLPTGLGDRSGTLNVHIDNPDVHLLIPLMGEGLPATGGDVALYRLNAGGPEYTDSEGNVWINDAGFINTGFTYASQVEIANTNDDFLYQSERWDHASLPYLVYRLPVQDGVYEVNLHFAEIYSGASTPGSRVFDVLIEGAPFLDNYDIAASAGYRTAEIKTLTAEVSDGTLEIEFRPGANNPKISAISVLPLGPNLSLSEETIVWGHVPLGENGGETLLTLTNTGVETAQIGAVSFLINQGVGHDFFATVGGLPLSGDHHDVTHPVNASIPPGGSLVVPVQFTPSEEVANDGWLVFQGNFPEKRVRLVGTGGQENGHPFLHVVIDTEPYWVDYDGNGRVTVAMDGSESHTHEFGHVLASYEWREAGQLLGTGTSLNHDFALGSHEVSLTLLDDNVPPETLTGSVHIEVVAANEVPGALVRYHPAGSGTASDLLDAPNLGKASFGEIVPTFVVPVSGSQIGSSPYTENVLLRMTGQIDIDQTGTVAFQVLGGDGSRLRVDGNTVTGPVALTLGRHSVDLRVAVDATTSGPLEVRISQDGGAFAVPVAGMTTHDETHLEPILNSLPASGIPLGGEQVTMTGLGFFQSDEVTVHWGDSDLLGIGLGITPKAISLSTPPGGATIEVTVETPRGTSNAREFQYVNDGAAPIVFQKSTLVSITGPTQAAWGPDGRLYVATVGGTIYAYTLDDADAVIATQVIHTLENYLNAEGYKPKNILGIAFNPLEGQAPVRIYVAHGFLFANGGACFEGYSPYSGQVSMLEGPNFTTVQPVITGLPVSNHDHGVNGLEFDNEGDLLISIGGNTNAGIPACNIGDLPESPLSGAILKAELSNPDFNGQLRYRTRGTGQPDNDQKSGGGVELIPGPQVSVFASGFRNAFDLVLTTWSGIYATDNGPNNGFGPASTGASTQGPDPFDVDELNRVVEGGYYGHPNRNRGLFDSRQNVYKATWADPGLGSFTQVLATLASSTNGIAEYRSTTFGGAMKGNLLAQKWNGDTYRIILSQDGQRVLNTTSLPVALAGLDILPGPGGTLFGIDYTDNTIALANPVDAAAVGLTVYDITPWRASSEGGASFTIGGTGFGDLQNTTVTIGGTAATLVSVSPKRIRGILPAQSSPSLGLEDVVVTVGGTSKTLQAAFMSLPDEASTDGAEARLVVDPQTGNLNTASTYNPGSFQITNQSTQGQEISRFTLNLSGAALPDQVFDPDGTAGDPIGKNFTVDSDPGVGLVGYRFLLPHDGGYDSLEVTFNDFGPGETFTFSADIDPTSIKGAEDPGPNHSGSVSGLDLVGADVLFQYEDGSAHRGDLYRRPGSLIGSEAVTVNGALPKPGIEVVGASGASGTASAPDQVVRVTGVPGRPVRLLRFESALYLEGVPGGGFDLDEFETNTVVQIGEWQDTLPASGFVEIPVTLTKTGTEGGTNHFVAVQVDAQGIAGRVSETVRVQYSP